MTTQYLKDMLPAFLSAFLFALAYSSIIQERYKLSDCERIIVYFVLHIIIFVPFYFFTVFLRWVEI